MYKKFEQNVLNPKHKNLNWFNRNYFYVTTFLIVGLLCLSYFVFQNSLLYLVNEVHVYYNVVFSALCHSSVAHLVGNIIGLVVISIFLERHFGSIKYLGLIILATPMAAIATFAFSGHWNWVGFSGVNFFLYAIFYLTLLVRFKEYFLGKVRWIFPVVILGLNLLITCWNGSVTSWTEFFVFGIFSDFHNIAHWSSCAAGALVGVFTCLIRFDFPKKKTKTEKVLKKKKTKSKVKSNNIVMLGENKSLSEEKKKQNIVINLNVQNKKK